MFTTMSWGCYLAQGGSCMHGYAAAGRKSRILLLLPPVHHHGTVIPNPAAPYADGGEGSAFRPFLPCTDHRFLPFLTETGSQTELAVTHRRQSIASILTETRIAYLRAPSSALFPQSSILEQPSRPSAVMLMWTVAMLLTGQTSLARWITQTEL